MNCCFSLTKNGIQKPLHHELYHMRWVTPTIHLTDEHEVDQIIQTFAGIRRTVGTRWLTENQMPPQLVFPGSFTFRPDWLWMRRWSWNGHHWVVWKSSWSIHQRRFALLHLALYFRRRRLDAIEQHAPPQPSRQTSKGKKGAFSFFFFNFFFPRPEIFEAP